MPKKKEYHKRILYLGLDPSRYQTTGEITHQPIIRILPRPFSEVEVTIKQIPSFTHCLFTSRTSVEICVEYVKRAALSFEEKTFIVLGEATADRLNDFGLKADHIAYEACAEGVIALLERLDLRKAHLFYPHSDLAREVIRMYLQEQGIKYTDLPLYTTVPNPIPPPDLEMFDEVVFTSPSTVKAFLELFSTLPPREKCRAIGAITENHFNF